MDMRILFIILILFCTDLYADHIKDPRVGCEPKRDSSGKIIRDRKVVEDFKHIHPLPPGENEIMWRVDHIIPLSEFGCHIIENLQWLPRPIKDAAGIWPKDRWERRIYKRKQ